MASQPEDSSLVAAEHSSRPAEESSSSSWEDCSDSSDDDSNTGDGNFPTSNAIASQLDNISLVAAEQPSRPVEEPSASSYYERPTMNITTTYNDEQLKWLRSKKLCDECQSIFEHWPKRFDWKSQRPGHTHHDFAGLFSSAENGCPICEIFIDGFVYNNPNKSEWPHSEVSGSVNVRTFAGGMYEFVIELSFGGLSAEMRVRSTDDHNEQVATVNEHTDSEGSWDLSRNWLKSCINSHTNCTKVDMGRALPSRLIYIESEESQPRLCFSQDLPEDTPYLTLSHCWGKKTFTTLTRDNLKLFIYAIPPHALSKTFREALKATAELGFHYIWIDSLCIVQDDPHDWEIEAATMGRIYANSTLNLSAVDAPDGSVGCFFRRDPGKVYGWKVTAKNNNDDMKGSAWNCYAGKFGLNMFDRHILSTRAWCYQERCLAPRSLGFGMNQMRWECRSLKACETFPNVLDYSRAPSGTISAIHSSKNERDLVELWFGVLVNYTGGKLTFSKDKLVALSGVARLFASRFGTTYLAGLWKEDLYRQLVWQAVDGRTPKNLESYRAPSWSWASTDSQVALFDVVVDGDSCPLVAIEEVFVTSSGDHFHQVDGGKLRMRCQFFFEGEVGFHHDFDKHCVRYADEEIITSTVYPDHNPHHLDGTVYYLPILVAKLSHGGGDGDETELHGLILKPKSDSYERVGCFEIRHVEDIEDFLSWIHGSRVRLERLLKKKRMVKPHMVTII